MCVCWVEGDGDVTEKNPKWILGFCLRPRENIEGIGTVGRTGQRGESLKLEEVRKHLHEGFRKKVEYIRLVQEEKAGQK